MASKMDRKRKKKKQQAALSERKSNGNRQGLIFNSCVNCETPLDNGTTKVAEFMLSFSESKRTFSVLEALTSVFELSTDLDQDIFPILTTKNLVMCPGCATVLASLYKSYVELMQMSKGSANICKLIRKAEMWHEKKGDLLLSSAATAQEEDDEDEEEEEEEENSESDSDAEYDKKVNSMLKETEIKSRARNGNSTPKKRGRKKAAVTPSPTGKKVGRPSNASKGKTPKKIAKANNGDSYEMSFDESDDPDDDDEDYGKKRKTPSKTSGDRGRTRQRNSTSSGRRRIRRRPSQTREDDYKCHECDRIFKFECRLIKHLQTHDTEKRLPCNLCDKSFLYSWMLENHVLGDHENQVPDECNICGLTFFREDIFKNHFCIPKAEQEAEREQRGHWCRLCGKGFSKLAHLTLHLRSHEEDKPLQCPSCNLRFKYEKCLQKHMSVHEKDFPCTSCKQMFNTKSKLRAHVQAHHSAKAVKSPKKSVSKPATPRNEGKNNCPNCNRSFGRKNDMMRHLKKKICFAKVDLSEVAPGDRVKSPAPFPDGYESNEEYYPRPSTDDEEEEVSDVDSMSPGVSNSEDDNHSLPSSPSSPAGPGNTSTGNLDLSEESSNSPVASPKGDADEDQETAPIKSEIEVKAEDVDFKQSLF